MHRRLGTSDSLSRSRLTPEQRKLLKMRPRTIELRDGRLQDLVADTGQDTLVVVEAERAVDLRHAADLRPAEHTQRERDHLHILGPGRRLDRPRLGPHVEQDRALEERDQEVGPFRRRLLANSAKPIEDDCDAQSRAKIW